MGDILICLLLPLLRFAVVSPRNVLLITTFYTDVAGRASAPSSPPTPHLHQPLIFTDVFPLPLLLGSFRYDAAGSDGETVAIVNPSFSNLNPTHSYHDAHVIPQVGRPRWQPLSLFSYVDLRMWRSSRFTGLFTPSLSHVGLCARIRPERVHRSRFGQGCCGRAAGCAPSSLPRIPRHAV